LEDRRNWSERGIFAPFVGARKAAIAARGRELDVPDEPTGATTVTTNPPAEPVIPAFVDARRSRISANGTRSRIESVDILIPQVGTDTRVGR